MKIFVVMQHDMNSSCPYKAFTEEEKAKNLVKELNKQEEIKMEIYNQWSVDSEPWLDSQGEEYVPEFGDYTFTYREIELVDEL